MKIILEGEPKEIAELASKVETMIVVKRSIAKCTPDSLDFFYRVFGNMRVSDNGQIIASEKEDHK